MFGEHRIVLADRRAHGDFVISGFYALDRFLKCAPVFENDVRLRGSLMGISYGGGGIDFEMRTGFYLV